MRVFIITKVITLQITFIVLQLFNLIEWSWFWVFSPILLPIFIMICLYVILLVGYKLLKKFTGGFN